MPQYFSGQQAILDAAADEMLHIEARDSGLKERVRSLPSWAMVLASHRLLDDRLPKEGVFWRRMTCPELWPSLFALVLPVPVVAESVQVDLLLPHLVNFLQQAAISAPRHGDQFAAIVVYSDTYASRGENVPKAIISALTAEQLRYLTLAVGQCSGVIFRAARISEGPLKVMVAKPKVASGGKNKQSMGERPFRPLSPNPVPLSERGKEFVRFMAERMIVPGEARSGAKTKKRRTAEPQ